MTYTVYILKSEKNGRYYVGQTQNLEARVVKHNSGLVKSTKPYIPWVVMWTEEHETRSDAMKKESQIKSWKKRKMIEALIQE